MGENEMEEEIIYESGETEIVELAPAPAPVPEPESLPVQLARKFRRLPYLVQAACFVALGWHLAQK